MCKHVCVASLYLLHSDRKIKKVRFFLKSEEILADNLIVWPLILENS